MTGRDTDAPSVEQKAEELAGQLGIGVELVLQILTSRVTYGTGGSKLYSFTPEQEQLLDEAVQELTESDLGAEVKAAYEQATTSQVDEAQAAAERLVEGRPEEGDEELVDDAQGVGVAQALLNLGQIGQYDTAISSIISSYPNIIGLTSSKIDWEEIFDLYAAVAGDEFPEITIDRVFGDPASAYRNDPAAEAGVSLQDWKKAKVAELLAQGPNPLNNRVWEEYAKANGFWFNDIGGEPPRIVGGLMNAFGFDVNRAIEVSKLSQRFATDPVTMGIAVSSARYAEIGELDPDKLAQVSAARGQLTDLERRAQASGFQPAGARIADPSQQAEEERFRRLAKYDVQRNMRLQAAAVAEGNRLYQYELMAVIHSLNPDLARQLYEDPYAVTAEQILELEERLGGWENVAGLPGAASQVAWLRDHATNTGSQRVQVNKDGAREAARQLAAAWNLPNLTDAQLDSLVASYSSTFASAYRSALVNPFNIKRANANASSRDSVSTVNAPDAQSFMTERLRQMPGYRDLFGNKPDGESEMEYVQRFQSLADSLLGAEFDSTEFVRAGQRQNETEAVGQSALVSGQAFESSTFQGRMARLAEAFRRMT